MVRIDLPSLPNYMKAILSLSIAQVAYSLPLIYGGYGISLPATKGLARILVPLLLILLTVGVGTIFSVPVMAFALIVVGWNLIRARRA